MIFEKDRLYHIFNQGNNKQEIFYNRENYIFFLRKIKTYILPYADVLAWCLMPNHFHLMVLVHTIEKNIHQMTKSFGGDSHQMNIVDDKAQGVHAAMHQVTNNFDGTSHQMNTKTRTLNTSIAIMLRSYTRAINKQEKRTGSLFKPHTKVECINCFKGVKPSFIQSNVLINNHLSDKQYPQVCFNYIHQNPVKANLVNKNINWEFSSAKDYAGLRNGKLVNKEIAKIYVDF